MKKSATWIVTVCLTLCCFFVGTSPEAYAAEEPLTRGAAAQLLMDVFDLKYDSEMTIPFTDVPESSPYYEAICICYHKGFMNGRTATTFSINDALSRSSLANLLYKGGLPSSSPNPIPPDVSSGMYYYESVCSVLALGIMSVDENGNFNPNKNASLSDVDATNIDALLAPTTTAAANLDLVNGSITISENIKGVTVFKQGETEIRTSAKAGIIRQTDNTTATTNTISVENGNVSLTVAGLNIASISGSPISLSDRGTTLTLTLVEENTFVAQTVNYAGICVPYGGKLTVRGNGSLNATGGVNGAGIGGGYSDHVGTITISGGTVTATGGEDGAGIGGGGYSDGGTITISGGTVTAIGGDNAAGIGGGGYSDGGTITISGGTVTAIGGDNAAGIGGSGDGGTITISGGTVTASGDRSAGIGGGYKGTGGTVLIANAEVTAMGYYCAIGGGGFDIQYGCDSITIDDSATVHLSCEVNSGMECQEKIVLNQNPVESAAHVGNRVNFSVDASGHSGLSYQWQVSGNSSTWFDVEGQTTADAAILMSAENDGYYYRCKLTNGWGNVIYSSEVQAHVLAFTKQPVSMDANLDDIVSFSVTPSCSNVTYQWQRSYNDGKSWTNVEGEAYATLIVNATLSESNAKYRCVITATNGDSLASDIVEINLDTGTLVTYTVQYFLQNADGSGYTLDKQTLTQGTTGETVTAPATVYPGFTENTAKSQTSGTVASDSSLILTRYFDRKTYSISFKMNGGSSIPDIKALYGAPVTEPDEPSRYGYSFEGWYADEDLSEKFEFDTMPLNGKIVYAKWVPVGDGRGTEYQINGLSIRGQASYEMLDYIPKSAFLVEVSVTNLSAKEMDTILLSYYTKDGQFVGMQYLYANPQIGQTLVFGSYVENSGGNIAAIKAFVLPTLGSPIPLAASVEFK